MSAPAPFAQTITWRPIDDRVRNGKSWLLNCGEEFAVAFWDGAKFVHPGTYGRELELVPIGYYDPAAQREPIRG